MRAGGVDPDRDARLVVLPPPLMTKGLESGYLDGFCVGAPWNSIAVDQGIGAILHFGVDLVRDCPEKVLALRADWAAAHAEPTRELASAILDASGWSRDPGNLDELSALVARECGAPISQAITRRVLSGLLAINPAGAIRSAPDYLRLDPDAITPRAADAAWLYRQMVEAGQIDDTPANAVNAERVYQAANVLPLAPDRSPDVLV